MAKKLMDLDFFFLDNVYHQAFRAHTTGLASVFSGDLLKKDSQEFGGIREIQVDLPYRSTIWAAHQ